MGTLGRRNPQTSRLNPIQIRSTNFELNPHSEICCADPTLTIFLRVNFLLSRFFFAREIGSKIWEIQQMTKTLRIWQIFLRVILDPTLTKKMSGRVGVEFKCNESYGVDPTCPYER